MELKNKEVVLGVTGGIACYKALDIVRGIKDGGGNVSVVMTQSALNFVTPLTFQTLSERSVATSMFSLEEESKIGHIKVGENANALVIAPATANIIGKLANGIADDYISTVALACDAPLIIAPAMNNKMWEHKAVQHNLNILKERGAHIVPPGSGFLACGTYGPGRMAEPKDILEKLAEIVATQDDISKPKALKGIKVLVTAGPTQEKIDAVRYLTNYSSGKMGYAIASYCQKIGAQVILITGPTNINPPTDVETIMVRSSEEMWNAVSQHASDSSLIIKAAAVSDYKAKEPNAQKSKKADCLNLELVKTKDILKELGKSKSESQFLVGFAAESQNVETYAKKKLKEKNLDLIVANNILQKDAGFNVDTNRVLLIDKKGTHQLPLLAKEEVAERILDFVFSQERWKTISETIQKY